MGLLDMLNPVMVFRLRLIFYGVLLFFSLFIIIGTADMKNQAKGNNCPLYCSIEKGILTCGSESNCNYPMGIAIIFQLLYLLFRFATMLLVLLGKLNGENIPFTNIFQLVYVGVDVFACFLTFIGACILSAGTNATCDIRGICDNDQFNDFLSGSKAAQAGSWISTFVWLFAGLIGFLTLWREGKIPFIGGSRQAQSSTQGTEPTGGPPMETPPNNPDDMSPKY